MSRQYLACKFRPGDKRAYTYHNDGEPRAVGDLVKVETREGVKEVTVHEIVGKPSFATEPVVA